MIAATLGLDFRSDGALLSLHNYHELDNLIDEEIDTDLAVRGGEHRGRRLERDRAAVKTDILVRRDAAASYVQLRRTLSALQHTRTL